MVPEMETGLILPLRMAHQRTLLLSQNMRRMSTGNHRRNRRQGMAAAEVTPHQTPHQIHRMMGMVTDTRLQGLRGQGLHHAPHQAHRSSI